MYLPNALTVLALLAGCAAAVFIRAAHCGRAAAAGYWLRQAAWCGGTVAVAFALAADPLGNRYAGASFAPPAFAVPLAVAVVLAAWPTRSGPWPWIPP